LISFQKLSD